MASAVERAVDTYIRACCDRDPQVREKLIQECWAEDGRLVTHSREIRGRAALCDMLTRFHSNPEFSGIRITSAIDATGTIFRFHSVADFRDGRALEQFDAGQIDATGKIFVILTFAGPLGSA